MQSSNMFLSLVEAAGVQIEVQPKTVSHLGRSKVVNFVSGFSGLGKGQPSRDVQLLKGAIPDYNESLISAAKAEIEAEVANEKEVTAAKEKEVADRIATLEAEKAALAAEYAAKETARKKPFLRVIFWLGSSLLLIGAILLVGLSTYNASFFLGTFIPPVFIWSFGVFMGVCLIFFVLFRDSEKIKMVAALVPFDLFMAVFVKPAFPNGFNIENNFLSLDMGAILLFSLVYGVQLYAASVNISKVFNPKELLGSELKAFWEEVRGSVI
jgi:hypothetical protein